MHNNSLAPAILMNFTRQWLRVNAPFISRKCVFYNCRIEWLRYLTTVKGASDRQGGPSLRWLRNLNAFNDLLFAELAPHVTIPPHREKRPDTLAKYAAVGSTGRCNGFGEFLCWCQES